MAILTIAWQISTIEVAGFSTWPSIAYSPVGELSVAYHSSNFRTLRLATLNGAGTWDIDTPEFDLDGDSSPSLVYRFTQPAISYVVGLQEIRYARKRGGTPPWTIGTVVPDIGTDHTYAIGSPSLALGPSQQPGVSFGLKGGGVTSLAYNPSGHPAIAYSGSDDHNNSVIKYAEWNGSQWHSETVGPGSGWCTLAFTPAGEPAIAFRDGLPTGSVIYAVRAGGAWHLQTIAERAGVPWLAFTPAGEPAISCDRDAGTVDYYVLHEGAWTRFVVEKAGKDNAGQLVGPFTFTSLAINHTQGGQPAIAYYDEATGAIKCAIGTLSIRGRSVTSVVRDVM